MISLPSCSTIVSNTSSYQGPLTDTTNFYNLKNTSSSSTSTASTPQTHCPMVSYSFDSTPSTLTSGSRLTTPGTRRPQKPAISPSPHGSSGYATFLVDQRPPLLESPYPFERDIVAYSLELETASTGSRRALRYLPSDYMAKQKSSVPNTYITAEMRTVLIDWLIEISASPLFTPNRHSSLREAWLTPDILPLAVNYIDRFLNICATDKTKFQLLGIVALFVALKMTYEKLPEKSELTRLTAETYTETKIAEMECLLLRELDCRLLAPISSTFSDYFLHTTAAPQDIVLPKDIKQRSYSGIFCQFLTELALLDYALSVNYRPSELALAQTLFYRLQITRINDDFNPSPSSENKSPPLPPKKGSFHAKQTAALGVYRMRSTQSSRQIDDILQHGIFSKRLKYLARATRCSKSNTQSVMLGYIRLWRAVCGAGQTQCSGLRNKYLGKLVNAEFQGLKELIWRVPEERDILKIFKTKYNFEA